MNAFFLIFVLAAPPAALSSFGRSRERSAQPDHPLAFARDRSRMARKMLSPDLSAMIARRRPDRTDLMIAEMKREIASIRSKMYENQDFILAAMTAFDGQLQTVVEAVDKTNERLRKAVADCPSSWSPLRHDLCLRAFDDRLEWGNASAVCRRHNASLLTFRDPAEFRDALTVTENRRAKLRCLWIGARFDGQVLRYDDGGRNTYSPHLYGSARDGDCVISCSALRKVKVGRFGCHLRRPFVCRKLLP